MRTGDAEYTAFEQHCKDNNLDRGQHPLHLIYLDPNTSQALEHFKAGFKAGVVAHDGDHSYIEERFNKWLSDGDLVYRLNDQGCNCDEIRIQMTNDTRINSANRYEEAKALASTLNEKKANSLQELLVATYRQG